MIQTLHPLFVHFPIALLMVYVGFEVISLFKKFKTDKTVFYIKLLMVVFGAIGASISSATGEGAAHQLGRSVVLRAHENFAGITEFIFWVLAVFYLLKRYFTEGLVYARLQNIVPSWIKKLLETVITWIQKLYIPLILSLVGLFTITITGALGGALVHGAGVDPMVQWAVDTFGTGTLPPRKAPAGIVGSGTTKITVITGAATGN